MNIRRKKQARLLRQFRSIHRLMGAFLFVVFFVVSCTGILLGWKKNSNGFILPKSHQGTSTDLKDWLPIDSLQTIAFSVIRDSVSADLSLDLQRIDARPDKGMVKFVFNSHYWGVQLDGATGDLLHIERRRSDLVENIHDGSIMDILLDTGGEYIKLVYTSIIGLALLLFTVTGFWLWYGPKRMLRAQQRAASRRQDGLKPPAVPVRGPEQPALLGDSESEH